MLLKWEFPHDVATDSNGPKEEENAAWRRFYVSGHPGSDWSTNLFMFQAIFVLIGQKNLLVFQAILMILIGQQPFDVSDWLFACAALVLIGLICMVAASVLGSIGICTQKRLFYVFAGIVTIVSSKCSEKEKRLRHTVGI